MLEWKRQKSLAGDRQNNRKNFLSDAPFVSLLSTGKKLTLQEWRNCEGFYPNGNRNKKPKNMDDVAVRALYLRAKPRSFTAHRITDAMLESMPVQALWVWIRGGHRIRK